MIHISMPVISVALIICIELFIIISQVSAGIA
jgi:hypothetical protein